MIRTFWWHFPYNHQHLGWLFGGKGRDEICPDFWYLQLLVILSCPMMLEDFTFRGGASCNTWAQQTDPKIDGPWKRNFRLQLWRKPMKWTCDNERYTPENSHFAPENGDSGVFRPPSFLDTVRAVFFSGVWCSQIPKQTHRTFSVKSTGPSGPSLCGPTTWRIIAPSGWFSGDRITPIYKIFTLR